MRTHSCGLLILLACHAAVLHASPAASPLIVVSHEASVAPLAGSPPPPRFTYQGELIDNGTVLEELVDLRFVFAAGVPGEVPVVELGISVVTGVPVVAGRFTTSVPLPFEPGGSDAYISIAVQRAGDPDFITLGAQPFTHVPLASFAERSGVAAYALAPWVGLTNGFIGYLGSGVSIGTVTPTGKLHLQGSPSDEFSLYGSGGAPMLHFRNEANARDWVFRHDGSSFHLQREVAAGNESMSWDVAGNVGVGVAAPGARLDVLNGAATQPALRARHTATGGNNATAAQVEVAGEGVGGGSAVALQALATATTGSSVAVSARSDSSNGVGVFSYATAASGSSTSVLARNNSSSGIAVDAWSASSSGSATALRSRVNSASAFAARFEGGITHVDGVMGVGTAAPNVRLHVNSNTGEAALRASVAGTTRLLVHENGGVMVGANGTPPPGGLMVNGPIQIPSVTRWYSVSGKSFSSEHTSGREIDSWFFDGLAVSGAGGADVYFTAPLLLPHGATITEMRSLVTDLSSTQSIRLQILRRAHADASFGILADAISSNAIVAQQTLVDDSIVGAVVDNELYAYELRALWQIPIAGNDWDIRLNTVRVAYTITSPLP